MTPAPIIVMRKPRRDGSLLDRIPWADKLTTIRFSSHSRRRDFNRPAYADVGHAATNIPGHHCVNVAVGGIGKILQERGGLHDLSRLTVAALWNLQLKPHCLKRMLALGIQPLYGRDFGARNGGDRGDTGACSASFYMQCASAAEANSATEFGSHEAQFVSDHPE
jgi:hypothetical protein